MVLGLGFFANYPKDEDFGSCLLPQNLILTIYACFSVDEILRLQNRKIFEPWLALRASNQELKNSMILALEYQLREDDGNSLH